MEIDLDKVDNVVLALLQLTRFNGDNAWKGRNWEVLGRLHARGMIDSPVGKRKSVVLTEAGLAESERMFKTMFAKVNAPS